MLAAGAGLLLASIHLGLKCDEGCDHVTSTPEWRHTTDAWQWTAQFVLALLISSFAAAILVLTFRAQ
jgi:hypothetical protein